MLIFWDLDDCLNHFTLFCLKHFGIDIDYSDYDPAWGRDIVKVANILGLKISGKHFWSEVPESVWADCPKSEIFNLVEHSYILTAPVRDPSCVSGKVKWINKHWDGGKVITEDKWLIAGEGRVLFDDCNENIDSWREHGGTGFLIPRPWNRNHGQDPRSAVLDAFEELMDKDAKVYPWWGKHYTEKNLRKMLNEMPYHFLKDEMDREMMVESVIKRVKQ